jgi:hypothetical protein
MSFLCAQPGGHRALARAAHAWNAAVPVPPWLASSMPYEAALPFFRRSWELDGFASESIEAYAIAAIQTGHREEASALAGACRSGPTGVRPTGEAIAARLEIDQGGFASGQRRLLAAVLGVERYGPKELRAYAPLQSLLLIARVLRNEPIVADPVVEAFVLSDPPRVELALEQEPHQVIPWVAFCMSASRPVADRCFARFEAWKRAGTFPKSELLDAYVLGATAYARGDLASATRAWGPVFRSLATTELLPWDALERFDPEAGVLAVPIVDEQVPTFAGVAVTAPREARRAARKGDPKRARELAEKVVAGWRTADVPVPAVAEMQALLATLK